MKKMIMAIIPSDEADFVLNALINAGYTATFTGTQGGMLRQSQLTMFTVVQDENLEEVLEIIRDNCRVDVPVEEKKAESAYTMGKVPVTKGLGGAIVFIWEIDRVEVY